MLSIVKTQIKKFFKIVIFFLFIISGAFLWGRGKHPSYYLNLKWGELDSQKPRFNSHSGVLIIFNSGGWGNTAFEDAEDFTKIIRGIKSTINKLGWKTAIVSYGRTKDDFLGRIQGLKEILSSFNFQSKQLADQIKLFLERNPRSKVLLAGLSLGANFVGKTTERICDNPSILAIKAGTPFWKRGPQPVNILEIINETDILATGNYKVFTSAIVKGIMKWLTAKIKRRKLSFTNAINIPGHNYDWKSPRLREKVISFLENNLKQKAGSL